MTDLFRQIKWQFLIFHKNNLVFMILGMTFFYCLALYFLKGIGEIEKFTTLLIFNEPTMVGFVFIGISIILEKDQEVLQALFITPINHHLYLLSRIFTLSAISLFCSWGMVLVVRGFDFNFIHFTAGAFFACVIFSFVGIYVVSFTTEILHFILRSIPIIILMSLPFLNYFDLTDWLIFKFIPIQGSLVLITNSFASSPDLTQVIYGYLLILCWTPVLYFFVSRTFIRKVVNS